MKHPRGTSQCDTLTLFFLGLAHIVAEILKSGIRSHSGLKSLCFRCCVLSAPALLSSFEIMASCSPPATSCSAAPMAWTAILMKLIHLGKIFMKLIHLVQDIVVILEGMMAKFKSVIAIPIPQMPKPAAPAQAAAPLAVAVAPPPATAPPRVLLALAGDDDEPPEQPEAQFDVHVHGFWNNRGSNCFYLRRTCKCGYAERSRNSIGYHAWVPVPVPLVP
jgi:hypothetical protein